MINWIATSSALILVVIMLRYLLRGRISLRLQYALWLIVLVRLLLPLEIGSSEFALSNAVEQVPAVREFTALQQFTSIEREENGTVVGYTASGNAESPVHIADNKTDREFARMETALKFRNLAAVVWKAGAAVLLAVLLAVNLSLSRRLRKNRTELKQLELLTVYITDQVETPCLFGLFGPAIYVTPEAAADETVLRHTIEHELTHYRHGDHIWALLRCLALAVHWYNPLVWWAAKLSRDDGELACDESTLLRLGENESAQYGRTLIGMTCKGRSQLLTTATTMTGSQNTLKERISLIAKKPRMAIYTLITVVLIAAVTVVFTFTGSSPAKNRKLHQWMQSVTAEELSYAYISEGFGTEVTSYTLTGDYRAQLVAILNGIEWNQLEMDQIGGTHERRLFAATGEYLDWEDEFIFGCCDDGRISISFTSQFGEDLSEPSKGWYVTSPELSSFINDILDGKSGLAKDASVLAHSDLNHNHIGEQIVVRTITPGQIYELVVSENGEEIWKTEASPAHMGWNTIMLYSKDGQDYLVQYNPSLWQGFGGYSCTVFSLENNKQTVKEKLSVNFEMKPGAPQTPEMTAFARDVDILLRNCNVLLSTEQGILVTEYLAASSLPQIYPVRYDPDEIQQAMDKASDPTVPQELTANAASFPTEPLDLVFASGAGAWGTYLTLNPDGSFTGDYGDSDMGTRYTCKFEGRFTNIRQISDYCWAMELEDIDIEKKEGTTWTENGIHYIAAGPHGISGGTTFILYAPGTFADKLPAACREWWPDAYNWRWGEQDSLDGWALYNLDMEQGFFTSWIS